MSFSHEITKLALPIAIWKEHQTCNQPSWAHPARPRTAWREGEPEWAHGAVTPTGVTGQLRDSQELTAGKMGQETPKRQGFIDDLPSPCSLKDQASTTVKQTRFAWHPNNNSPVIAVVFRQQVYLHCKSFSETSTPTFVPAENFINNHVS